MVFFFYTVFKYFWSSDTPSNLRKEEIVVVLPTVTPIPTVEVPSPTVQVSPTPQPTPATKVYWSEGKPIVIAKEESIPVFTTTTVKINKTLNIKAKVTRLDEDRFEILISEVKKRSASLLRDSEIEIKPSFASNPGKNFRPITLFNKIFSQPFSYEMTMFFPKSVIKSKALPRIIMGFNSSLDEGLPKTLLQSSNDGFYPIEGLEPVNKTTAYTSYYRWNGQQYVESKKCFQRVCPTAESGARLKCKNTSVKCDPGS